MYEKMPRATFTNLFSVSLCCVYLMLKYLIVSQALQVVPYRLELFVVVLRF